MGIYDGTADWPANNPIVTQKVSINEKWQTESIEFECPNTQDYVFIITYWDRTTVYLDNASLCEEDIYISNLDVGISGDGIISYKASYTANEPAVFGAALYNGENKLIGFKTDKAASFEKVDKYGDYKIKTYLWNKDMSVSKTVEIVYDENTEKTEQTVGAAEMLTLSEHDLALEIGKTGILDALITPEYAYNKSVVWSSSDEAVAVVSEKGIITAVGEGNAVITAADGDLCDSCDVTVSATTNISELKLNKTEITLPEKDAVCVLEATSTDVVWSSDNENTAVVTDGVVTAVGKGKATITARTSDGRYSAKCSVTVEQSENTITNDTFYTDTDGNPIYSQGGCICRFGDKYYWYGVKYKGAEEYFKNPAMGKNGNSSFESFTCYSSTDLVNWKFEGDAFKEENNGWVGRMGVAYNANTKKYVLISQYSPGLLFAVSDKPEGPFVVDHIFEGKLPIENGGTGDQTVFQDDDGKAYLICSCLDGRKYLYVIPLRNSDFLEFDFDNIEQVFYDENGAYIDEDGKTAYKDKLGIEGNCMFKYNGSYYFTGSDLYGWNSSRVYVLQSDKILGDYNSDTGLPYIMNGVKDNYAHNSQAGFYVTIHGSEQDLVLYCGDRWCDFAGNGIGYNQWIPVTMDEKGRPCFNNLHQWKLDAKKGTWEVAEGNNYISNPEFEADRISVKKPTGWTAYDTIGGYANSNTADKIASGNFAWKQGADEYYTADLKQNIKDLPDGKYVLKAWIKSSGGQNICKLYVESGGKEYNVPLKTEYAGWTPVVIKNIDVKDGRCTVGLYSDSDAGNWVQIDNVELVKICE